MQNGGRVLNFAPTFIMNLDGFTKDVWSYIASLENKYVGLSWNIQKKQNKCYVSIVLPIKDRLNHSNLPRPEVGCLNQPSNIKHVDTPQADATVAEPKPKKRKSPSQKRRDKRRLDIWKRSRASRSTSPQHTSVTITTSPASPDRALITTSSSPTVDLTSRSPVDAVRGVQPTQLQHPTLQLDPILTHQLTSIDESLDIRSDSEQVADLFADGDSRLCFHCGRRESLDLKMKLCTRCECVEYCSKECQIADWQSIHKNQCAFLAGASGDSDSE